MKFMNKKNEYLTKPISLEFIERLKSENAYLKTEMKEEKEKLINTIGTLNKELEEVKDDNRKLTNEIEHYEQLREKIYYNTL